jgi:hypothetical protein
MPVEEALRRAARRPVIAGESDTMEALRRWLKIATWGAPNLKAAPVASAATAVPTERTLQARIKTFLEQLRHGDLRPRRSYEHEAGDLVAQRMEQAREYVRDWRAKAPRGWKQVVEVYIAANLGELAKPRGTRRDLPLNPENQDDLGHDPRTMPPRTGRGGRPKDVTTQQTYDAVRHIIDDRARKGRDPKGRQIASALQSEGVPLPRSLRQLGTNWIQVYDVYPARVRKFFSRARQAGLG